MSTKNNPHDLGNEIRDQLTTIAKVKGLHYASIVESAMNLINVTIAFSNFASEQQKENAREVFIIADNIIGTNVALMISLWQTSGFEPKTPEEEEAMYVKCEKLVKEIDTDIRMLQNKQREYQA